MDEERLRKNIETIRIKLLGENRYYVKLNYISNIIQIRVQLNETNLYEDIKNYLTYSINAVEETNSGYYNISIKRIEKSLKHLKIEERISLCNYLIRLLKTNAFEESLVTDAQHVLNKLKFEQIKANFKINKLHIFIKSFAQYNIYTCIISIVIILFVFSLILQPAPFDFMAVLNVNFKEFTSNSVFDNFCNLVIYYTDLDSNVTISPINIGGIILLLAFKVTFILVLVNYLFKELVNKI